MEDKRITNENRTHHGDAGFTRAALGRPKLSKSDPVLRFYSYGGLTQHYLRAAHIYLCELQAIQSLIGSTWRAVSPEAKEYTAATTTTLEWLDDVLFYLSGVIHSIYKIDFDKIEQVEKLVSATSQLEDAVEDFKAIEFRNIGERCSEFVKSACPLNLLREYIRLTEAQFWVVVDKLKLTQPFHYVAKVMPYLEIISAFLNRCSDYLYWFMKMINSEINTHPYAQWCSGIPEVPDTICLAREQTLGLEDSRMSLLEIQRQRS
jgi:cob(I)alamin adenosyltransferase